MRGVAGHGREGRSRTPTARRRETYPTGARLTTGRRTESRYTTSAAIESINLLEYFRRRLVRDVPRSRRRPSEERENQNPTRKSRFLVAAPHPDLAARAHAREPDQRRGAGEGGQREVGGGRAQGRQRMVEIAPSFQEISCACSSHRPDHRRGGAGQKSRRCARRSHRSHRSHRTRERPVREFVRQSRRAMASGRASRDASAHSARAVGWRGRFHAPARRRCRPSCAHSPTPAGA